MVQREILMELSLSYDEQIEYLKKKYGEVPGNYFATDSFASKNKRIRRTSEGLQIHHVEERVCPDLAQREIAVQCPPEWQTSYNLVYCNLLEHLVLHIKTSIHMHNGILDSPHRFSLLFKNGIAYICATINDVYTKDEEKMSELEKNYLQPIKDNYSDYIFLLHLMEGYVIKNYQGSVRPTFNGDRKVYSNGKLFKRFYNDSFEVFFRDEGGKTIKVPSGRDEYKELAYLTGINELRKVFIYTSINSKEPGFSEQIFRDMLRSHRDHSKLTEYIQMLKQNFRGHGFPQFSNDLLDFSIFTRSTLINIYPRHSPRPFL